MRKKIISNTILVLLILLIPVILYIFNFKLILFDTSLYSAEFEKQGVYEKFENADEINGKLLTYFKDEKELVDIDIYDDEEKQHLLDVKKLINISFSLLNISLIVFLVLLTALLYLNKDAMVKPIIKVLIGGGILTICFSVLDLLFSVLNFDLYFDWFHKMLFEGGTWLFSEGSNLIAMYPIGLFYNLARQLLSSIIIHAFVLVLVGFFIWVLSLNHKIVKKEKYLNKALKRISRK